MLLDVVRVALQLLEVERRMVVETLPGRLVEIGVERVAFELSALALGVLGQNLGLGGREHAIEPAQHRHRQHDTLVLRWAIWTAKQVGDLPDEVREVVMVGHWSNRLPWCSASQLWSRFAAPNATSGLSSSSSYWA